MTNKHKVALIGCGNMGLNWDKSSTGSKKEAYSHFASITKSDQYELVAVSDPNPNALTKLKEYKSLSCYQRWQNLIEKHKDLSLVVIASPDETHSDILREIANFAPPCVFVEKPICIDFNNCEKIIKTFKQKNISLFVNYSRRFMKEYRELKIEIEKELMGKALCLTIHYTGGFAHNGVHFLDLVHWFFGHPDQTKILHEQSEEQTQGLPLSPINIHCHYKSGLKVNIIGIGNESPTHHQVEFIASTGGFRIQNNENLERYRMVPMKRFDGFMKFSSDIELKINQGLALPNAYLEISDHINYNTPLYRPTNTCLEINSIIKDELLNRKFS